MNFDLNIGQWIVIVLSAFLFVWFFAANSYNRRRGIAAYRWLRQALEEMGNSIHAEWIGASSAGARLMIEKASRPFRRVEAIYLLEPREFPPYWAFSRLRGKRDEVVIKITLRTAPKGGFEIRRDAGRRNPKMGPGETGPTLMSVRSGEKYMIISDGQNEGRLLEAVETFLADHPASIESISLQPKVPHLVLHARLAPLLRSPAEAYFTPLQNWFQDN
jgi:hypothetical protein